MLPSQGCEWDAFHHLATIASPEIIKQVDAIYLELHLSLQMSTAEDLAKWATMHHLLFEREGFELWWVHPNAARAPGSRMHASLRKLPYDTSVWEKGPPPQAWEIGMRRPERVAMKAAADAQGKPARCPKGARSAHPRQRESS